VGGFVGVRQGGVGGLAAVLMFTSAAASKGG